MSRPVKKARRMSTKELVELARGKLDVLLAFSSEEDMYAMKNPRVIVPWMLQFALVNEGMNPIIERAFGDSEYPQRLYMFKYRGELVVATFFSPTDLSAR